MRAGAGQPADRHVHDEPSRGAEHHPARFALHQPGARAAPRRLRSGAGRLHHDHARSAQDRAQRSALLRAGRHHGRLPFGRRLRESRRLFRLGGEPGLQAAAEPRRHLAADRASLAGRRDAAAGGDPEGAVRHRLVHRARPVLPAGLARGDEPHGSCISATTGRIRRSSRPAPYNAMYRPEDMPKVGARVVGGGGGEAERAARLLCEQHQAGELLPGRQEARLGDDRGRGRPDARDLLRADERDRRSPRPRVRLPQGDRPVGRHADRLHLRSRRAARRPSPAGQDRLLRRVPIASR